jgi:hypothetical protein
MIIGHYSMKKIFMFLLMIFSFMNMTNGSSLGPEGIPWKDIHFWRFWQSDNGILNEKVLILNEKKEPVIISFMLAHTIDTGNESYKIITDSTFGIVGGPWQISANGYQVVYMPKLTDSIKRTFLYKVICNISDENGIMDVYSAKPTGNFPQNRIITTMNVDNRGGSSFGNYWWEHSSLFATSGETVNVRFVFIPGKFDKKFKDYECFIKFKDPTDSIITRRLGEPLKLIKVERGNLPIESKVELPDRVERWKSLKITFPPINEKSEFKDFYSVDFILEAPQTTSPEIHYFGSLIMRGGNGGTFLLPLIVLPK